MKKFLPANEKGFTLIELIMVIVILGILAAVAIPRFIDLKRDAKIAVADGATAALRGAIVMLHAKYILDQTQTYDATTVVTQIQQEGITVAAGGSTAIDGTFSDGGTVTWSYTNHGTVSNPGQVSNPTVGP